MPTPKKKWPNYKTLDRDKQVGLIMNGISRGDVQLEDLVAMLAAFQESKGLAPDGYLGPKTIEALKAER